jgi:hypothetical protein
VTGTESSSVGRDTTKQIGPDPAAQPTHLTVQPKILNRTDVAQTNERRAMLDEFLDSAAQVSPLNPAIAFLDSRQAADTHGLPYVANSRTCNGVT